MNAAATVKVRPAKRMMMKVVLLLGPTSVRHAGARRDAELHPLTLRDLRSHLASRGDLDQRVRRADGQPRRLEPARSPMPVIFKSGVIAPLMGEATEVAVIAPTPLFVPSG